MDRTHVLSFVLVGVLVASATVSAAGATTGGIARQMTDDSGMEPMGDGPPQDMNSDGEFEDVDGSGTVDFNDLVTYYQHMNTAAMTDHTAAFDYTGDSELDFNDLVALYQSEIAAGGEETPTDTATPGGNETDGVALPGAGTASDPYRIDSFEDLRQVRQDRSAHYELVADVDASASATYNHEEDAAASGIRPLSNASDPFTGTFDGNGYAITNLSVDGDEVQNTTGLFGTVGEGGRVEALVLRNLTVYGHRKTGSVAGVNAGTVHNVSVERSEVHGTFNKPSAATGGVVGRNRETGEVVYTRVDANVTGENQVGGIVGRNEGRVARSFALGSVGSGGSDGAYGGQIYCSDAIESRRNGSCYQDGVVAVNADGTVTATYPETTTTVIDDLSGIDADGAAAVDAFEGLDFESNWTATADAPVMAWRYEGTDLPGVGTRRAPFRIDSADDLREIEHNRSAHYVLSDDVDASETATWHDGRGFDPVGSGDAPFDGTFDGQGHAITGLTIDRPETDAVGLFGRVGEDAQVRSVALHDASVTGADSVGAVAGHNRGAVRNVSVRATVTGSTTVGGVVGTNAGRVGHVRAAGMVSADATAGGVAGTNTGQLYDSLAVAEVQAEGDAGGVVARDLGSASKNYWDTQASGQPTSDAGTGLTTAELTGQRVGENVTLNLMRSPGYDQPWVPTAGYPAHRIDRDPSPLPGTGTAADPYRIDSARDLQAMRSDLSAHYVLTGDVNASGTATWHDGRGFVPVGRYDWNFTAEQKETYRRYDLPERQLIDRPGEFEGTFDGRNHTITGLTIHRPDRVTVGLFGVVGANATVRDVHLRNATVSGGSVNDVAEKHSGVHSPRPVVGALAGRNRGTIEGVSVTSHVEGHNGSVGGVVGTNGGPRAAGDATVRAVTAEVTVVANEDEVGYGVGPAGGVVGRNHGTVRAVNATSSIAAADTAGGVVGHNGGTVVDATAAGSVDSKGGPVGGIVGESDDGRVTRVASAVGVSGDQAVGGVVGENMESTVENVTASGHVEGESAVGGVVGFNDAGLGRRTVLRNAVATGAVEGNSQVGGLVGINEGTVDGAIAVGAVTGGNGVGGLVGNDTAYGGERGTVTAGYYDATATGLAQSAGGTGLTTAEMTGPDAAEQMSGLDLDGTWQTTGGYPVLAATPRDAHAPGPSNATTSTAGS